VVTRRLAAAALALGAVLLTAGPAAAQTTGQYNRALVHRYGCSTLATDIFKRFQPSSVRGWLVVDFAASGGLWVHVTRADYPTVRALLADDLHPQAVCRR
jgi:hypothetical protein